MAFRVEIGEDVESAIGLNITGASVEVRFHGGAQAPVYDSENGGALVTQPLTTVNGKIGADYPSGAWVAQGDYDLLVTFGGDTLTYFWSAIRGDQFVTTLPAGAGTSAPEDGETAIELYDAVNGAAWLRRYRAAATQWDMIGGPPPAAASLPGTPRTRQEIYLTGGTPAVQHLRYNGATWDYVGSPPTIPVPGSPLTVSEPGLAGQVRAGRNLVVADFTTLLNLPTTPVLLAPLNATTNLGSGGALVNKGTVTFAAGIMGTTHAAQFTGNVAQALYIADTGAADPFRIKTGSWGCWFKTAKRGVTQVFLSKLGATAAVSAFQVYVFGTGNVVGFDISNGTAYAGTGVGTSDVADDRWHFAVVTFDGTKSRLYVDGALEAQQTPAAAFAINGAASAPLNVGGSGADAGAAAVNPFYGRADEAFVTADVLTDDQVRLLYAASIPHGYATTPTRASGAVRRRQRGGPMATTDFPAQPVRLHNFVAGALTDQGSSNLALTNNGGAVSVTGPNGVKDDAFNFVRTSTQYLSSSDTGIPTGSVSFGAWLKTSVTAAAVYPLMAYGTTVTTNERMIYWNAGIPHMYDTVTDISGGYIADGVWHLIVAVFDAAGVDGGLRHKLYVDGRMIVSSPTAHAPVSLVGANAFRIGRRAGAGTDYAEGQISRAFVYNGVLSADDVHKLYHLGSRALGPAPFDVGEMVEGFDATNMYAVLDRVDGQHQLDLAVAA